jgi:hypothetical protein
MLTPDRNDVAPLTAYTEDRFGRWLINGLRDLPVQGRLAFRPMHTFVKVQFDIVEDLVAIFEQLQGQERSAFQAGVAIALAHADYSPGGLAVIENLLNLSVEVGAWEALDVISEQHRLNWLRRDAKDAELFGATIRATIRLARRAGVTRHTRRVAEMLERLARTKAFPPAYAEATLIALCRLRPKRAWASLGLLRPKLDPMLDFLEDDGVSRDPQRDAEEARRAPSRKRLVQSMENALGDEPFQKLLLKAWASGANPDRDWWMSAACMLALRVEETPASREAGHAQGRIEIPATLDEKASETRAAAAEQEQKEEAAASAEHEAIEDAGALERYPTLFPSGMIPSPDEFAPRRNGRFLHA